MSSSSPNPDPRPAGPLGGLALVGYRGTGKSTVGRILAGWLGRAFADADVELERRLGRTIRDIFARDGEPTFRDHEQAILLDLAARPGLILATGGGAVLRETNRRALRGLGAVAWLTADPEEIARRLRADAGSERPALTAAGTLDEVVAVLAARELLYREAADFVIETDGRSPEEVAEAVLRGWQERARHQQRAAAASEFAGGAP